MRFVNGRSEVKRGQYYADHIFEMLGDYADNVVIAGGFARYMCSTDVEAEVVLPEDIDLFLLDETYYNEITMALVEGLGREAYFTTDRSMSFKPKATRFPKWEFVVQLITPRDEPTFVTYGTIDQILDCMDLTVCMIAVDSQFKVTESEPFCAHELEKWLKVHNSRNCPETIKRIIKYTGKGYSIDMIEILKIMDQYALVDPGGRDSMAFEAVNHDGDS